jgi:hypothetical protein
MAKRELRSAAEALREAMDDETVAEDDTLSD